MSSTPALTTDARRKETDETAAIAASAENMQHQQPAHSVQLDSRFSCNICLEAVTEPVVTQCGHLYCWPCLYQWLEPGMLPNERQALAGSAHFVGPPVNESRRVCPVCKAACAVPTIVPIYVRTEPTTPDRERLHSFSEQGDDTDIHTGTQDSLPEEQAVIHTDMLTSLSSSAGIPADDSAIPATGLRQRLRFRSRDSEIPARDDSFDSIPARPSASSSMGAHLTPPRNNRNTQNNNNNNGGALWVTPLSPNHRGSLSHGLAFSLQQALRPAVSDANNNNNTQIPPLHRPTGGNNNNNNGGVDNQATALQADPDATEFLSRILLMLGSFVILCLLLF